MSCICPGNQLLIIINTIKVITILQPLNFNVFLHGYFLQRTLQDLNELVCKKSLIVVESRVHTSDDTLFILPNISDSERIF